MCSSWARHPHPRPTSRSTVAATWPRGDPRFDLGAVPRYEAPDVTGRRAVRPSAVGRVRCPAAGAGCEDAAVSSDLPSVWLFIDVDGVLNAVGEAPLDDHRLVVQVENGLSVFPIRYDPRVVDRLNALTRDGLVQLIWLTTWARAARDSLAPAIGLDPGGRVLADLAAPDLARHPYDPHRPWWKLALLLGVIEDDPDRPGCRPGKRALVASSRSSSTQTIG